MPRKPDAPHVHHGVFLEHEAELQRGQYDFHPGWNGLSERAQELLDPGEAGGVDLDSDLHRILGWHADSHRSSIPVVPPRRLDPDSCRAASVSHAVLEEVDAEHLDKSL